MPSKDEIKRMEIDNLLHPIVSLKEHEQAGPLIIVEDDGLYILDITGAQILDGFSGLWNVLIGHG